jgi:hypothetical protein
MPPVNPLRRLDPRKIDWDREENPEYRVHEHLPNILIGKWTNTKGTFDNFMCTKCQFATLDEYAMREHQFHGDHPWVWPGGGIHPYLKGKGE